MIRLKGCCGERIILEAKEEEEDEEANLHKRGLKKKKNSWGKFPEPIL